MPTDPDDAWVRHQADAARLAFALATVGAVAAASRLAPRTVDAVTDDVATLIDRLPDSANSLVIGLIQIAALVIPAAAATALIARRSWRELGLLAFVAALATAAMTALRWSLADRLPATARLDDETWFASSSFPSSAYLAAATAAVTASVTWLPPSWRKRFAWSIVAIAGARLITTTATLQDVVAFAALGSACGSIGLLVFGSPPRRLGRAELDESLRSIGLEDRIDRPTTTIRVFGRDERDADVLWRAIRSLRTKGLSDQRAARTPRRAADHDVLMTALAQASGARTAVPLGVVHRDDGAALAVFEQPAGGTLLELGPDGLNDDIVADLWSQVDRLHRHRLAHRDLDLTQVRRADGAVVLTNFSAATVHASDVVLAADTANLLISIALVVGAQRAVDGAMAALGADGLTNVLPLLQAEVLSPRLRRAIQRHPDLVDEVRTAAAAASGTPNVELADVKRLTVRGVVSLVGGVVMAGYLLSLAANWGDIWSSLRTAPPSSWVWLTVLVAGTFVGGAISMMGSVTINVPFVATLELMLAQTFLNRFTPANAGGMALRTRYLQLHGLELNVAVTAVGLTSVATGCSQVLFLVVLVAWGNSTESLGAFSLPDTGTILAVVVAIAALIGLVVLSGWGRRLVRGRLGTAARDAWGSLVELAQRPERLAMLLGGAAAVKLVTILAFAVSVEAFGVQMGLAQASALYLVASAVGAAVPTPGGVGGVEAALTAALLGAGVEAPTAAAIVLLFRFATFWLPTVPSWWAFRRIQRAGMM